MYNSASGMFNSAFDTNIIVNSDGNVQFLPPGNFLSTCQVSKLHQWRDTNVLEWLLLYELFSAKSQHRWAMKITQNMSLNPTFMIQYVVDLSYKQFLDDSVVSQQFSFSAQHWTLNFIEKVYCYIFILQIPYVSVVHLPNIEQTDIPLVVNKSMFPIKARFE